MTTPQSAESVMPALPGVVHAEPLEWTDDHGHRYRLVCAPLTTGEVMFDLSCLDCVGRRDGAAIHTDLPRHWAVAIAERLKEVTRGG